MEEDLILDVEKLKKYFPIKEGILKRIQGYIKAVDDVSFSIKDGETLGLVGESGCGKTTTGRCIIRLFEPTGGSIKLRVNGEMVDLMELDDMKAIRRKLQYIFQDPFSSLDSRMSVRDIIAEGYKIHNIGTRKERTENVQELLERVGLRSYQMNRYPHEFSGGQRQRIGVARALALNPDLIICDEPVSALDVSVQAQVINLLRDLQEESGFAYLFIAHDLSVVEHISDRVMVMYLGKVVEMTSSDELYTNPQHPYTEALMQAIPSPEPGVTTGRVPLSGDVPDPSDPPAGCNFHPRCSYARDICSEEKPELMQISGKERHFHACHLAEELDLKGYTLRKEETV